MKVNKVRIPKPPNSHWAESVSRPVREYLEALAQAQKALLGQSQEKEGFSFVPFLRARNDEQGTEASNAGEYHPEVLEPAVREEGQGRGKASPTSRTRARASPQGPGPGGGGGEDRVSGSSLGPPLREKPWPPRTPGCGG